MRATRNLGRVVGLWYLSLVLFGPLTLLYIPNKLFLHGDAAATATNIAEHQITAAEILWGVWLFPMGALTYKSGFLPRFIGVWLIINGIAYVVLCVSRVMLPEYSDKLFIYLQPALFGELVIMLWLVIKGAGQTPLPAAPDPA